MKLGVHNEIGALEEVVVHRPGDEIERMTQHELDRLLFDDILSPRETTREHDTLAAILRAAGATVHEIGKLLEGALDRAPLDARAGLLARVCELAAVPGAAEVLAEWPAERLAAALIAGVYWSELEGIPTTLARLRSQAEGGSDMALRPVPNLMFMRDPCITIFDRVVVGRMATSARAREPFLVGFAMRWGAEVDEGPLFAQDDAHRERAFRSIEGGDVLVLSPKVILIGCSERTSAPTIERMAHEALFPACPALERIYALLMPEERSFMHLDTILTQLDRGLFVGHRPLLAKQGQARSLSVVRLERDAVPKRVSGATPLDVLRSELGSQVELVPCGGEDPLHQQREQWTDGANAVCLSPGHVILYARNVHTIRALADHGFEEVRLHAMQPADERDELIRAGMAQARIVFSFSGSELSRARGGARCLTMPLRRAPE